MFFNHLRTNWENDFQRNNTVDFSVLISYLWQLQEMPRVDEMLHFLGMLEPKHQKSYNVHERYSPVLSWCKLDFGKMEYYAYR